MTKLKCIILLLFFNCFMAVGQDAIRINHLPFIQGLTEQSVSIIWTTDKPATGWVELAPDDSSHFYFKERPKYYA
ncbi:MAG: hypothetical protein ACN6PI_07780, partial [Sphingobacterium siyangense]